MGTLAARARNTDHRGPGDHTEGYLGIASDAALPIRAESAVAQHLLNGFRPRVQNKLVKFVCSVTHAQFPLPDHPRPQTQNWLHSTTEMCMGQAAELRLIRVICIDLSSSRHGQPVVERIGLPVTVAVTRQGIMHQNMSVIR